MEGIVGKRTLVRWERKGRMEKGVEISQETPGSAEGPRGKLLLWREEDPAHSG